MFSGEWLNDQCCEPNQLTFSQTVYKRISVLTVLMTEYRHGMDTHVHNIHIMDTYQTHMKLVSSVLCSTRDTLKSREQTHGTHDMCSHRVW